MTNVTKRTVHTDALETLGTLIDSSETRDAIHLAVLPVTASVELEPGERITQKKGYAKPSRKGLGIVDPFLTRKVPPGKMFWMILRPRLVTSLRHVWEHPEFPLDDTVVKQTESTTNKEDKLEARKAIGEIARDCLISAKDLIQGAHDYLDHGHYLNNGPRWEGISVPEEFWDHFEVLSGRKIPEPKRGNFLSCSC